MDLSAATHSITLDPTDSLSFALALGSSPQAALVISNPSSVENVAFKVKTTRPMRYLVRPNQWRDRPQQLGHRARDPAAKGLRRAPPPRRVRAPALE